MQATPRSDTQSETRLRALIADLWWRVKLMNADILEEEAKGGVFDRRLQAYPILAFNLCQRRDNLLATIAMLENAEKSVARAA